MHNYQQLNLRKQTKQLLPIDNTCFYKTIAFLTLFDELCMYTPTHTIPNKSHLGEVLRPFPTRQNCHPLSHQFGHLDISGSRASHFP